jgi:hypothetical protein
VSFQSDSIKLNKMIWARRNDEGATWEKYQGRWRHLAPEWEGIDLLGAGPESRDVAMTCHLCPQADIAGSKKQQRQEISSL